MKRTPSGFTLIELMITVVIIGIIAAIAYPSYSNYMTQTRRSDAQIALTTAANQQERFFTECNSYAPSITAARPATCPPVPADSGLGLSSLSPERHYVITLVTPTTACPISSCYVLQAAPATTAQGGTGLQQSTDGNFRITSTGVKTWDKANDGAYSAKWTDK
ncbi:MAG: prepilin-type N-terminal cleavage/methylation domain-containing protein [Gammaproteobacteria bacterium]|nr:prepilin-type N-terminal cleavage/methylation domain-containing protein [Gammaproteobacteria bacterium]